MRILTKKILRDIKFQKGRSLSIIFIIILAMGLYSGILLSYYNVEDSFDQTETELNLHSVRFVSTQPIDPTGLDIDSFSGVKAWESRLSLLSHFYINGDTDNSFTAPLYSMPIGKQPNVDKIIVQSGNFLSSEDEVMVEQSFLDDNSLKIGDSISLTFGQDTYTMKISAGVFSSEHLYNVNPKTGLPDLTSVAPVWLSDDQLQEIASFPGDNEVLVRFLNEIHNSEERLDNHVKAIKTYLTNEGIETSTIKLEEEADQEMKEGDLGSLDEFARVFGGVVLMIALFAIYDNISKLIASQRNYIGTMRALGGSKRKVAFHYTNLAMVLSSIGVFAGIPFGLLVSYGMVTEYSAIIGIPTPEISLHLGPLVEAVAIHLGLALVISILTSMRAAGIEPREAMSSAYITQIFKARPIVEQLLAKMGSFSPTTAIPIRNIFRNKRKSLLTIFTFAMSIVLMTTALGFTDSFNSSLQYNYDERQMYDMEVYLTQPMMSTEIVDILDQIDGVRVAEGFVNSMVSLDDGNGSKSTSLYAFEESSKLREFDIIEGSRNGGLLIPSLLADDLGLEVGEELEIMNQTFEISAIVNEIISESVYLNLDVAQSVMGLGENITGVIIEADDGEDIDQLEEEIQAALPVSIIISTEDVKDSIEYLIQGLFAIIGVMVFIGFMTVALFSFNTIVLEIISRENEFVNLKSLGSSRRKILKIILIQSLIVSFTGSLISIPLSLLITEQAISAMMQGLMNIETVISVTSFGVAIGSALLASFTGIIAAYRHVMKIDLVEAMRNRVSN